MAKYTNETYIQKAEQTWGNRFDYSRIKYINSYHKIEIICKHHNQSFSVSPIRFIRADHNGNFCNMCKHNHKMSHDNYMEKIKKYEDLYDLSCVKFKTTQDNIKLKCHSHGVFYREARFLSASGICIQCPKCKSQPNHDYTQKIANLDKAVFYKLKVTHVASKLRFMKVGITSNTSMCYDKEYTDFNIEILEETVDTGLNVIKMEREFKEKNKNKRFYIPHYIFFNGRTECFILDEEMQLKSNQIKIIRDGLIEKQNGLCLLCQNDIIMPTLDHFHSKRHNGDGRCRGVLCNSCNRMLGSIENTASRCGIDFSDMPKYLENTIKYIEKIHQPLIHPSEKPSSPVVSKRNYNKLKKQYTLSKSKKKFPEYPKSKKLTLGLQILFEKFDIQPFN